MGEAIDRTDPKMRDAMAEALAEAADDYRWERLLAGDGRLSWTVRGAFKDSEGSLRRSLRETLRSEAAPEPWIDEGVALRVCGRLSRRLPEGEWTPVCVTETFSNVYEVKLPAGTADGDVVSRVEEMCNAGGMSPAGDSDSEYGRKVVMA